MKITLFFPFGSNHSEVNASELIGVLAKDNNSEVTKLRCNGALSLCDRDKQSNWKRENTACFHCQCGQEYVNSFADLKNLDLSKYIDAEFSKNSKLWVENLDKELLINASIASIPLSTICGDAFKNKFNKKVSKYIKDNQVSFYKHLILNSIRVFRALKNFADDSKPDLVILSGKNNFVSNAARLALASCNVETLSLFGESNSSEVLLRHSNKPDTLVAEINVERLNLIRKNTSSWPEEFKTRFYPVLEYIGINSRQLNLPIEGIA